MNLLIVGSGPAAVFGAETLRRRDRSSSIVLVTEESQPALSPVMVTYWMSGRHSREALHFRDPSWSERMSVAIRPGCRAVALHPETKKLTLSSGEVLGYDRVLIATGASPIVLPIPGRELRGVSGLRQPGDAEAILDGEPGIREVVVIGGGFVGLKLACHLNERGVAVRILEKEPKLAPRMFDPESSRLIERLLSEKGIVVETGVEVTEILGAGGEVRGVRMKDGRDIPCQRIVQAVGVRPNVQWLAGSGIEVQGGVVVNDRMETSAPDHYGAGDVAMTLDSITGTRGNNATWFAATAQGKVAAANMTGGDRRVVHNFPLNALNLFGLQVMAAGHPCPPADPDIRIVQEPGEGSYRSFALKGRKLVGFILIGDVSGAGLLLSRMERGEEFDHEDLAPGGSSFPFHRLPSGLGFGHGRLFHGWEGTAGR